MKVLNVLAFGIAGGLGLMFLLQTLHRLSLADAPMPANPSYLNSPPREPRPDELPENKPPSATARSPRPRSLDFTAAT